MHRERMKYLRAKAGVLLELLQRDLFGKSLDFDGEVAVTAEPLPFAEAVKLPRKKVTRGEVWGTDWDCGFFKLHAVIPSEWAGHAVVAKLNLGGEGLLFDMDGKAIQSVTNTSLFNATFLRELVPVTDKAQGGESVDFYVDAAANDYFGLDWRMRPRSIDEAKLGATGLIRAMEIWTFYPEVQSLYFDVEVIYGLLRTMDDNSYRARQLAAILSKASDLYAGNRKNAAKASDYLKKNFYSCRATASSLTSMAVGHAHIDVEWLWPLRETIRKCGRTFSTQLSLMDRYPGYVFGASQPQLYQFTKDHYPDVYERIKKAVAAAQWELQGGMWVEADGNLIGGEAMVRQFLYGKNFYRDEFGIEVKNLWLPDVFGYSAAMPQIIRGCGCDYFVTQKLSWNLFNKFPHNTFVWRGIDGTEVLSHCPPENTYNANVIPEELVAGANNFAEADVVDSFLTLFGVGDGGAGPKEDHIERAMRLADVEGCPKVVMSKAEAFLDRLNAFRDELEVWSGELYLENHQGTFTTQALVKKRNRQLEHLLKQVEFVWSTLPLVEYPAKELEEAWKVLLLHQFHDIIPGSSIGRVYKETHEAYEKLFAFCREMFDRAAEKVLHIEENAVTLFNTLGCEYRAVWQLPEEWHGVQLNGLELIAQNEGGKRFVEITIPPYSSIVLERCEERCVDAISVSGTVLENDVVRYEFDGDGLLIRGYDKVENFEFISPAAPGNDFGIFADNPAAFDAWNVEEDFGNAQTGRAIAAATPVKVTGPVRQTLTLSRKIGNSTIEQLVSLGKDRELRFDTKINWNESNTMLRVKFPVNIYTSEAQFDIQYGRVGRTTACNTPQDMARYEVCAHRYVDLSDNQYGVALLNDCKYGFRMYGNVINMNVLRSPKYPDPEADLGEHEFTVVLLPHVADQTCREVIDRAAVLNEPAVVCAGKGTWTLPCKLESKDIMLEVVKKAEKSNDLVIRLVETAGCRSEGLVKFYLPVQKIVQTNMIEWTNDAEFSGMSEFAVALKPFEIRTYRVELAE